jgi:hypothetical protein
MTVKTIKQKNNLESLINRLSKGYPGPETVCLKKTDYLVNAVKNCGADINNLSAINWNPKEQAVECIYKVK